MKNYIYIFLTFMLVSVSASSQIKRRPGSTVPRNTESVTNEQQTVDKSNSDRPSGTNDATNASSDKTEQIGKYFVISIEGENVYTDVIPGDVSVGDKLVVYKQGGYMTHPVSKKRIKKSPEIITELIVKNIYADYIIAVPAQEDMLSKIQVGMSVVQGDRAAETSSTNVTEVSPQENHVITKDYETQFQECLQNFQNVCPIEISKHEYIEGFKENLTTVCEIRIIKSNGLFKAAKKSNKKGRFLSDKIRNDIRNNNILVQLAQKTNRKYIIIYYNKDKTSYFEEPIL